LGGLSRRPAHQMALKARAGGCDTQGGEWCGLGGTSHCGGERADEDRRPGVAGGILSMAVLHDGRARHVCWITNRPQEPARSRWPRLDGPALWRPADAGSRGF
jgi:hypothetical protein